MAAGAGASADAAVEAGAAVGRPTTRKEPGATGMLCSAEYVVTPSLPPHTIVSISCTLGNSFSEYGLRGFLVSIVMPSLPPQTGPPRRHSAATPGLRLASARRACTSGPLGSGGVHGLCVTGEVSSRPCTPCSSAWQMRTTACLKLPPSTDTATRSVPTCTGAAGRGGGGSAKSCVHTEQREARCPASRWPSRLRCH